MHYECSCGVIPLKKEKSGWKVLLVQHHPGNWWGFPKGHVEPGEAPRQTAERELREETALYPIRWLSFPEVTESYQFQRKGRQIQKQVTYFFAEVEGEISIEPRELVSASWVDICQAEFLATFEGIQRICRDMCARLPQIVEQDSSFE